MASLWDYLVSTAPQPNSATTPPSVGPILGLGPQPQLDPRLMMLMGGAPMIAPQVMQAWQQNGHGLANVIDALLQKQIGGVSSAY